MAAKSRKPDAVSTGKRETGRQDTHDLAEQVVQMKDEDGKSLAEIAKELGVGQGKIWMCYHSFKVEPKDRIKFKNDEELSDAVVKARTEDKLSWGTLAARTGETPGRLRKLFRDAGYQDRGHRIGKGGRYPGSGDQNGKAAENDAAESESSRRKGSASSKVRPAGRKKARRTEVAA